MIKRILDDQIRANKRSVLLLGPRQTGKTTLLKKLKPDLSFNLAREREYQELLTNPGHLEDQIERYKPKLVFIDEIQRLPNLLNSIQAHIDDSKVRFLLTGSSARKLKRGQANLLPGRLINKRLFPLTIKELDYKVENQNALRWGFLPGILTEKDSLEKTEVLASYSANYLKEEIQQEALTRNLAGYSRFIQALPALSGRVLDYSKIATKNKLNRFSVHRFFEILEETLLGQRISPLHLDCGIPLVKHPKFYFFDNGVMNGILNEFEPRFDYLGVACETIVFNQLQAGLSYLNKPFDISFFRSHSGIEVDFVVSAGGQTHALEVKANDNITSEDTRGLKKFREINKKASPMIVHFGKSSKKVDGIWCLPWVDGIKEIVE